LATIETTATGDWSAAGTWVGGTPPGDGDLAVLKHSVTVDDARVIGTGSGDAIVMFPDALLTVPDGATLTMQGRTVQLRKLKFVSGTGAEPAPGSNITDAVFGDGTLYEVDTQSGTWGVDAAGDLYLHDTDQTTYFLDNRVLSDDTVAFATSASSAAFAKPTGGIHVSGTGAIITDTVAAERWVLEGGTFHMSGTSPAAPATLSRAVGTASHSVYMPKAALDLENASISDWHETVAGIEKTFIRKLTGGLNAPSQVGDAGNYTYRIVNTVLTRTGAVEANITGTNFGAITLEVDAVDVVEPLAAHHIMVLQSTTSSAPTVEPLVNRVRNVRIHGSATVRQPFYGLHLGAGLNTEVTGVICVGFQMSGSNKAAGATIAESAVYFKKDADTTALLGFSWRTGGAVGPNVVLYSSGDGWTAELELGTPGTGMVVEGGPKNHQMFGPGNQDVESPITNSIFVGAHNNGAVSLMTDPGGSYSHNTAVLNATNTVFLGANYSGLDTTELTAHSNLIYFTAAASTAWRHLIDNTNASAGTVLDGPISHNLVWGAGLPTGDIVIAEAGGVVTVSRPDSRLHGARTGAKVMFRQVGSAHPINDTLHTITDVNGSSLTLDGVDGTGWPTGTFDGWAFVLYDNFTVSGSTWPDANYGEGDHYADLDPQFDNPDLRDAFDPAALLAGTRTPADVYADYASAVTPRNTAMANTDRAGTAAIGAVDYVAPAAGGGGTLFRSGKRASSRAGDRYV
jgi:hypothetical protein